MIAYHIDRCDLLFPGQTITLSPNPSLMASSLFSESRVSKHGEKYLGDCFAPELGSYLIEYNYELVRQKFFPYCISRFQSFFALERIEDILHWPEFLSSPFKLLEIEILHTNFQKFDASFLAGAPNLIYNLFWSPQQTFDNSLKYWNGEFSSSPKPELLILPPVIVKNEIPLTIDF